MQMELDPPPMPYCPMETVHVERDGLKMRCTYWPLVMNRDIDWSAITDDYDGGETEPVGRGATMEAAIQDLLEQLDG